MFRNSSNLAAAYGVSVTAAMVIDSMMAFFVIWKCWKWPLWKAALLIVPFLLIEQVFFAANMLKILEGGWVPIMIAWRARPHHVHLGARHARCLPRRRKRNEADLDWLVRKLEAKPPHRVPGTAVFLTGDPYAAPTSLMHNLKHNRVLHERNIMLTHQDRGHAARAAPRARHDRAHLRHFIRVIARYGFMETPSVPKILEHCRRKDCNIDIGATSFFLSRRSLQGDDQVRDAALAGTAVHRACGERGGRDDLLPDPDRPRRRGRHAGRGVAASWRRPIGSAILAASQGALACETPSRCQRRAFPGLKPGRSWATKQHRSCGRITGEIET